MDFYFLENPFLFLSGTLLIPFMLYRKTFFQLFEKKALWEIAREIEKKYPLSGKLISSADFIQNHYVHNDYMESLYIEETYSLLHQAGIRMPVSQANRFFSFYTPMLAALIIILSIIIKQSPYQYLKNTFFPQKGDFTYHLDYTSKVESGKDFVLKIKTPLNNVKLFTGYSPQTLLQAELERVGSAIPEIENEYTFTAARVTRDFYFQVIIKKRNYEYRLPVRKVHVFRYPVIKNIEILYQPPGIYGIPARVIKDTGSIEGFYRSMITVTAEFTNELKKGEIVFLHSKKRFPLIIRNNKAIYTFPLVNKDEYKILVTDIHGHENVNTPVYSVIPLLDKPPVLNIIFPNKNLVSRNTDYFRLKFSAVDDYGIRQFSVELQKFEKKDSPQPLFKKMQNYPVNNLKEFHQEQRISLMDLTVNPGEMVKYRISVTDSGGNIVYSRWYQITFPGIFERLNRLDRDRENTANRLSQILEEQRRVRSEIQQIQEKIRSGSAAAHEMNKLRQLIREQSQIFNRINQETRRIERMQEEIQTNPDIRDRGLSRRLEEINKLLKEVLSREAREALERMQRLLNRMQNNQEAQPSEAAMDMTAYERRLERTIEMLRMLRNYQRLIAARTLLKNMKTRISGFMEHVGTINSQREKTNLTQNAGRELETHRENFLKLLKSIKIPAVQTEIERLAQIAEQEMKKRIGELVTGNIQNENIQGLQSSIDNALTILNTIIKSMSGSNISQAVQFLHRLVNEMIFLSTECNELQNKLTQVKNGYLITKAVLLEWTNRIQNIQSIINARKAAFLKAMEGIIRELNTFERYFDYLISHLGIVLKQLTENKILVAENRFTGYRYSHHQFILILTQIYHQLSNAKPQPGMQSENQNMNSLAEMQRRLNEQVQRLWSRARSGNLSEGERQYLRRLAQRQQELSQRIESLRRGNSETARRSLAALEAIRREMEQVARELRENRIQDNVIATQRRILRRMLDSERGLESRERDDRQRRGEQTQREAFGESEEIRRAYSEFMKKMQRNFIQNFNNLPPYYQEMMRQYMQTLRRIINE